MPQRRAWARGRRAGARRPSRDSRSGDTAGETCRYEDDVLAIMQENIARLWQGENELLNQVI
jgi:hypothetical protein